MLQLSPEQWFEEAHKDTDCLWIPPPAAASVAMEMMSAARLKIPHVSHIFVVPRLMTHLWRKQLSKDADLMFEVPVGTPMWPAENHEPLIIAVLLPIVTRRDWRGPWIFQGSDLSRITADELAWGFRTARGRKSERRAVLGGELWKMWKDTDTGSRDILRQFLKQTRSVSSMPEGMVRLLLHKTPIRQIPSPDER